jgi:plasmid stabilization system protein ParE
VNHTLVVTPDARADVDDARTWYENQQAGRGDTFIDELHDRLEEV